jgi:hypothetical protein
MQMRMQGESLPPSVQDAEKADVRPKVSRIGCNLLQSLRGSPEQ